MFDETSLKIGTVFADRTRNGIYQHFLHKGKDGLTVKEIAEAFSIHPNVARLHLSKLEEIGLLESDFQKAPLAGRPGKTYRPKDQGISFSFPPRDYQLLSTLVLETLADMGDEGVKILKQIGRAHGHKIMEKGPQAGISPMEIVKNIFEEQGLCPEMLNNRGEKSGTLQITFRNCSFLEAAQQFPRHVCTMHQAMIHGILEAAFGQTVLKMGACIISGDKACTYSVMIQEESHER